MRDGLMNNDYPSEYSSEGLNDIKLENKWFEVNFEEEKSEHKLETIDYEEEKFEDGIDE